MRKNIHGMVRSAEFLKANPEQDPEAIKAKKEEEKKNLEEGDEEDEDAGIS